MIRTVLHLHKCNLFGAIKTLTRLFEPVVRFNILKFSIFMTKQLFKAI